MKAKRSYVPPLYIPLDQTDSEVEIVSGDTSSSSYHQVHHDPVQWSSGICACFDDIQSCCIGLLCPCFLFGKNAEFLGAGGWMGPCMTHFILWGVVNSLCCMLTDGILGWSGSIVACYACGYRKAIRTKYNLQEAPCGDLTTHLCCHLCAICQEYREIRDRSGNSAHSDLKMSVVTAPEVQTMESPPK